MAQNDELQHDPAAGAQLEFQLLLDVLPEELRLLPDLQKVFQFQSEKLLEVILDVDRPLSAQQLRGFAMGKRLSYPWIK